MVNEYSNEQSHQEIATDSFQRLVLNTQNSDSLEICKAVNDLIILGPLYNSLSQAFGTIPYHQIIREEILRLTDIPDFYLLKGGGMIDFELDKFLHPKLEDLTILSPEVVVRLCTEIRLPAFGALIHHISNGGGISSFLCSECGERALVFALSVALKRSRGFSRWNEVNTLADPIARFGILLLSEEYP